MANEPVQNSVRDGHVDMQTHGGDMFGAPMCSCGKNDKTKGRYSEKLRCKDTMRCTCFIKNVKCTTSCKCVNCGNNKTKLPIPLKEKHRHAVQIKKSIDSLVEAGVQHMGGMRIMKATKQSTFVFTRKQHLNKQSVTLQNIDRQSSEMQNVSCKCIIKTREAGSSQKAGNKSTWNTI